MAASTLLQIVVSIVSIALLVSANRRFTKRFNIPSVFGELMLGILIGPTLLGHMHPDVSHALFPTDGLAGSALQLLSHVAMWLMLFTAGVEINLKTLRQESRRIGLITCGSFLLPFILGTSFALLSPLSFSPSSDHHFLLSLFIGVALAISALPVIIRVLMDLGLYRSRIGLLTVSSASVTDVMGWTAFTILLAFLMPTSDHSIPQILNTHSTFLFFVAGIVAGNIKPVSGLFQSRLSGWIVPVLSPLFFISIGARINFAENLDIILILTILFLASTSKLLGTIIGGKISGLNITEAVAIGFALNARGAMEIMLGKQALEAGLIDARLFVSLVVMAIVTSLVSAPAIKFLILRQPNEKGSRYASPFTTEAEQVITG